MRTRRVHNGMRSGISIVEMMIAVILFGVISSIGFKYYKNYFDVAVASKQAMLSAVIDQASQLSNAYDVYQVKTGSAPANIADLTDNTVAILTQKPDKNPIISATGWELASVDLDSSLGGANDKVFRYKIDGTTADKLEFCNVFNNLEASNYPLDTILGDIGTADSMYDGTANVATAISYSFKYMMCFHDGVDYTLAFVKDVDNN